MADMNFCEFKDQYAQLTESQKNWLQKQAKLEGTTEWHILETMLIPPPVYLTNDGKWK